MIGPAGRHSARGACGFQCIGNPTSGQGENADCAPSGRRPSTESSLTGRGVRFGGTRSRGVWGLRRPLFYFVKHGTASLLKGLFAIPTGKAGRTPAFPIFARAWSGAVLPTPSPEPEPSEANRPPTCRGFRYRLLRRTFRTRHGSGEGCALSAEKTF